MSGAADIAARLDRLPIARFHKRLLIVVGIAFFFDISDIFTFSYAAPALIQTWGLTVPLIALTTSLGFLGMFVGAVSGGMISDRLGRKRSLVATVSFFSVCSLLNGLAPNLPLLLVARFLTGIGISSATVVVMTIISEFFPPAQRGRFQSWAMVIALAGIPICGWVARLVVPLGPEGWRFIFVWGALGLFSLILIRRIPESPRWYFTQGRLREAEATMAAIEREVAAETGPLPAPRLAVPDLQTARKVPFTTIFSRQYIGRTFTLWAIWIFQTLGFYGFQAWVPTLLVKSGVTVTASLTYTTLINVGAVPGALLAVWLSEKMERKNMIAILAVLIACMGMFYGLSRQPALIVTFGFGVALLIQTFASICYAYTPEQYPTEVRNTGAGFAYGTGRLANVANAFIVSAIYGSLGYVWVFAYIGAAWLGCAFVAFTFGAKTLAKPLEALSPVATAEIAPSRHPASL
jgi:putative MFS transporter